MPKPFAKKTTLFSFKIQYSSIWTNLPRKSQHCVNVHQCFSYYFIHFSASQFLPFSFELYSPKIIVCFNHYLLIIQAKMYYQLIFTTTKFTYSLFPISITSGKLQTVRKGLPDDRTTKTHLLPHLTPLKTSFSSSKTVGQWKSTRYSIWHRKNVLFPTVSNCWVNYGFSGGYNITDGIFYNNFLKGRWHFSRYFGTKFEVFLVVSSKTTSRVRFHWKACLFYNLYLYYFYRPSL